MSIKIDLQCNECLSIMTDGDDCFCDTCYNKLKNEIDELKSDISNLESDKDTLQQEKEDLTEKLMKIEDEKQRSDL